MPTGKAPKKASDHIPWAKDQGIDFLAGAGDHGISIQSKQITQSGASPFSVVFADQDMLDMADATYTVLVGGETVGAPKVDQSTIATTGFDIAGGADTEVLHVLVVGRVKDQIGPAS
jgi:hypothetical protein